MMNRPGIPVRLQPFVLLFVILAAGRCSHQTSRGQHHDFRIRQGKLDLSKRKWRGETTLRLDGEWECYPDCLLLSRQGNCDTVSAKPRFVGVPHRWGRYWRDETPVGAYGQATYRLQMVLPHSRNRFGVAMHLPPCAYRVWANGVPIGGEGELGNDGHTHEPTWTQRVLVLPQRADTLELIVEVAAFDHPSRGFGPIVFGELRSLERQRHRAHIFRGIILGCLLAVAMYYLVLVALGKRAKEDLYISMTCLAAGANLTVYFENLLVIFAPVPFWAYYYLFWVTTPLVVLSLFLFSRTLFPREFPRLSVIALATYIVLAWGPLIVAPGLAGNGYYALIGRIDQVVISAFTVAGVAMLIVAARRRKSGAECFVLGVMLIAGFGLFDYFQNVYTTWDVKLYPFGLLGFLLCQQAAWARNLLAAEQRARQHREQLAQAEKLAALGAVTAMVAHEVSNPNNAILLAARSQEQLWSHIRALLEAKLESEGDFAIGGCTYLELRQDLAELPRRIAHNAHRIKDIVAAIRISAHPSGHTKSLVQLNDIVRWALEAVADLIRRSTRAFGVQYGRNLPLVRGNTTALEQVVVNLVRNACQALRRPAERIVVTTEAEDQGVVLTVRDEGRGIDSALVEQLFKPFSTTKPPNEGTGLGLAITHRIVEQHGGRIEVDSQPGQGTTFRVYLPVHAD